MKPTLTPFLNAALLSTLVSLFVEPAMAQNFALRLDGATITFPHHPALNTGEPVTFEGWVRADGTPTSVLYIFARKKPRKEHKELFVQTDGSIGFLYTGSPWPQVYAPPGTFAFDGAWHHVAAARRADRTYKIFYDGQEVLSGGPGPCWGGTTCNVVNSDPQSTVGGGQWSAMATGWEIDSVRVSTVPRYDAPFVPRNHWKSDAETVFLLHFDEGQGAAVNDSSAFAQSGSASGSFSWVEGVGGNRLATYVLLGAPCAGSTTPRLTFNDPPVVGELFQVGAEDLPIQQLTFVLFGFADDVGGIPLPLDLTVIGMPRCLLHTSAEIVLGMSTGSTGAISVTARVPQNLSLLGATFRNQVFVRDAAANPLGMATTEGGEGVVGNYR